MAVKVEVDRDKCIGCGACVAVCPDNFEMAQDGKSKAKKSEVKEAGCNEEAAASCPVQCIKVTQQ